MFKIVWSKEVEYWETMKTYSNYLSSLKEKIEENLTFSLKLKQKL